jgi:hypothetical protein
MAGKRGKRSRWTAAGWGRRNAPNSQASTKHSEDVGAGRAGV